MPPPAVPPAPRRKLGCWFYGCTSLLLLVILAAVGVYFGARQLVRTVRDNYTSTQPVAIERVELPPGEWTNLQQRIDAFAKALDQGEAQELVLTEQELNAFISNDPRYKKIHDRVHVAIQGDQIGGQISLPIPEDNGPLEMLGLSGRYLNGNATFDLNLSNGRLHVYLQQLEVNGKAVPEQYLKEFRKNDLAKDMQDPKAQAALQKYESIQVQDGKLILKSKAADPAPSPPEQG